MNGWKTYTIGFLMIFVAGLKQMGYISEEVFKVLEGVLTGGGLMALRAGVTKNGPNP